MYIFLQWLQSSYPISHAICHKESILLFIFTSCVCCVTGTICMCKCWLSMCIYMYFVCVHVGFLCTCVFISIICVYQLVSCVFISIIYMYTLATCVYLYVHVLYMCKCWPPVCIYMYYVCVNVGYLCVSICIIYVYMWLPVCVRKCRANSSDLANLLSHPDHVQGKGRSPRNSDRSKLFKVSTVQLSHYL